MIKRAPQFNNRIVGLYTIHSRDIGWGMTTRVLGFDLSTSCIGFGCLDIDGYNISVVKIDHYKPSKDEDVFVCLAKTRKFIKKLINDLKPDTIAIEDIIQFMGKGSSAHTIIVLAQMNRMCGLVAYDYLQSSLPARKRKLTTDVQVSPTLLSVSKIRHGLKLTKELPAKEEMPALIEKHLNIQFPYIPITKGKNKWKPAPESYDRADGCAVALYMALQMTNQLYKKAKKPKT